MMGAAGSTATGRPTPRRLSAVRTHSVTLEDGTACATLEEQSQCEDACMPWLGILDYGVTLVAKSSAAVLVTGDSSDDPAEAGSVRLLRDRHVAYLTQCLSAPLPPGLAALDASRVWIVFWCLQTLELLDAPPVHLYPALTALLSQCQAPGGGFGGGPGQHAHGIATYAAVHALAILSRHHPAALEVLDTRALHGFFMSLRAPAAHVCGGAAASGVGFRAHEFGEMDVRIAYTVLSTAQMVGIMDDALTEGVADFLLACQTYEGGFAGAPGNEAHGGYTYCALAALTLLGQQHRADVPALQRWLCLRQCACEGGFSGRTNKLVDGCYSFWQGACFPLLPRVAVPEWATCVDGGVEATETSTAVLGPSLMRARASTEGAASASPLVEDTLLDTVRLQLYILLCCQQPSGGLRDKPAKNRDQYHSCYCASGLAIAQHTNAHGITVVGHSANQVPRTDPIQNLRPELAERVHEWFRRRAAAAV